MDNELAALISTAATTLVAAYHDGRMLAIGYTDGTIDLWNVENPANPVPIGHRFKVPRVGKDFVSAIAFSPDGSLLAENAGSVRLWSIVDPANPKLLPSTLTATNFLVFRPFGHILVTGESGNSAQLWDVTEWNTDLALADRPSAGIEIHLQDLGCHSYYPC